MAASGATLAVLTPSNASLTKGYSARYEKHFKTTGEFGKSALRFPDGSITSADWCGIIPLTATLGYSATTGIKADIWWSSCSGKVAGSVVLGVELHPMSATDLVDPFDESAWIPASYEDTATTAVSTTAFALKVSTISHTIAHIKGAATTALAAGDGFRCRVRRKGDHASDTLTDDIYVHLVHLYDY